MKRLISNLPGLGAAGAVLLLSVLLTEYLDMTEPRGLAGEATLLDDASVVLVFSSSTLGSDVSSVAASGSAAVAVSASASFFS